MLVYEHHGINEQRPAAARGAAADTGGTRSAHLVDAGLRLGHRARDACRPLAHATSHRGSARLSARAGLPVGERDKSWLTHQHRRQPDHTSAPALQAPTEPIAAPGLRPRTCPARPSRRTPHMSHIAGPDSTSAGRPQVQLRIAPTTALGASYQHGSRPRPTLINQGGRQAQGLVLVLERDTRPSQSSNTGTRTRTHICEAVR